MKCSWQNLSRPLKGQCPYDALLGLLKPPVLRVVLIVFRKPPARPGCSEKLTAISLEKMTPFDYNKFAATNCKNNQKEVITK